MCFEAFQDNIEREPKVFRQCGHSFCQTCVSEITKQDQLVCPNCYTDQYVSKDTQPVKNFALLAAMDELGNLREQKGISKFYKPKY